MVLLGPDSGKVNTNWGGPDGIMGWANDEGPSPTSADLVGKRWAGQRPYIRETVHSALNL